MTNEDILAWNPERIPVQWENPLLTKLKLKNKNNNNSLNILYKKKEDIYEKGSVASVGGSDDGSVATSDYNEYGIHKNVLKFINIQSKRSGGMKLKLINDRKNYMKTQQKYYDKMIEQLTTINKLHKLRNILNYIVRDDFRCKNILTMWKLMKNNKDWVPYRSVILEKVDRKL